MASKDTVQKTIMVALGLCIVCSLVVSTAAVMLKPVQIENKALDRKKNILSAAGLLEEGKSVEEQFAQITTRVIDLRTGKFTDDVDPATFDQDKAAKDPQFSAPIGADIDQAKINRLEFYSLVYLIEKNGNIEKFILPVRGYGLWSTMYGFIALESDANTVVGLGFYSHGETPGLGGEIDNPNWISQWPGKLVYKDGKPELGLIKGKVNPNSPNVDYQVDGLSGATLTANGVTNLVQFWLGENGFKPFLNNVKAGGA